MARNSGLFLVSFLLASSLALQLAVDHGECAGGKKHEKLMSDFDHIIKENELRRDLIEYLNVAPTSHKARAQAKRMLGLPMIKDDDGNAYDNNCIKDVLELILSPLRKNIVCKKKCKACPDIKGECPCLSKCPIIYGCPPCPYPIECIPPLGESCPKQPKCACNSDEQTASTTTTSTTTTTTTTTTKAPVTTTSKPINKNGTIELKANCDYDGLININQLRKLFDTWSNERFNTTIVKPDANVIANEVITRTVTVERTYNFEFDRNLKILCKNATLRSQFNELIDAIPATTGGKEMELATKILSRFGDSDVKPFSVEGTKSRPKTFMNARNNLKKILAIILDEFKRNKCKCPSCIPSTEQTCDICKNVICPKPASCPSCPTHESECPQLPNCPKIIPCKPCVDENNPDYDGNVNELDDLDKDNVVRQRELEQTQNCKGFTCPFTSTCGKAALNPLTPNEKQAAYLNGGEDQIYGEFPQHARIKIDMVRIGKMRGSCSGVLISDKHVLTAAHCVEMPRIGDQPGVKLLPQEFTVILGDHDTTKKDPNEVHYNVSSICSSKKFDDPNGDGSRYDFAVLELNATVSFNDHIQPVCLPYEPLPLKNTTKCFVVGAGITKYNPDGKHESRNIVQKMAVERTSCRNWGIKHDDRSRHCFTKSQGKGDSCGGDSGGPILCLSPNQKRWVLAGLVSYGSERCDGTEETGWVGVYSRIPALLNIMNEDCKI